MRRRLLVIQLAVLALCVSAVAGSFRDETSVDKTLLHQAGTVVRGSLVPGLLENPKLCTPTDSILYLEELHDHRPFIEIDGGGVDVMPETNCSWVVHFTSHTFNVRFEPGTTNLAPGDELRMKYSSGKEQYIYTLTDIGLFDGVSGGKRINTSADGATRVRVTGGPLLVTFHPQGAAADRKLNLIYEEIG
ncbi:unnamed protein product, partial [Discosporangium mesarthrocarpum]